MGRYVKQATYLKGKVETGTPATGSNRENVYIWVDEFGRPINPSYSESDGSDYITDISPAVKEGIGPITSLDAVTATGSAAVIQVADYTWHTYQVFGTGMDVTGSLFQIDVSNDGTNYQSIFSASINDNENADGILYSAQWNFEYVRCGIFNNPTLDDFDGTFTVIERHKV